MLALAPVLLTGCGGVAVTPLVPDMPKPLIVQFPADVGVHYADDFRGYVHKEERWGSKWQVALGASHVKLIDRVMNMAFRHFEPVGEAKSPQPNQLLDLVIEPHIERYSFITPRDSGGDFFAVTIKYRLDVYAPDGRLADTLNFTGYGGAPAAGLSTAKPLIAATQAAMRDAAAKFLVQFPEQKVAHRLRAGEPLVEENAPAQVAAADSQDAQETPRTEEVRIEAVPIVDVPEDETAGAKQEEKNADKPPAPAETPKETPKEEAKEEAKTEKEGKEEKEEETGEKTGEKNKENNEEKKEDKKEDSGARSQEQKNQPMTSAVHGPATAPRAPIGAAK